MTRVSSGKVQLIGQINERDIRARSVRGSGAVLLAASLVFWWWLLFQDRPDLRLLVVATSLILIFPLATYLSERRTFVAGLLAVIATLVSLALIARWQGVPFVAPLFVLPALLVFGMMGTGMGALAGLAVTLLLASPVVGATNVLLACEVALVICVVYAVLLPRERILQWSWQRSAEATELSEQLRDRQGELNKALGQLQLAYQLLERTNRELELARREAEDARRLKEEFAANVSHELRTPLNIILGFAEIMHRTPEVYDVEPWPQMLRRDVGEIWRSARYISELVSDILELARFDALQMPVTRENINLRTVIQETSLLGERLALEKGLTLELDIPDSLPPVSADKTRIRQVILNLLNNAIRFTDQGRVTIKAEVRGEDVIVSVEDTGIGIPAHELGPIFSEFHRVEGQEARGGKGLGLAIAKRFISLHGGRIWAESELGAGSVFRFSLPLSEKSVSRLRSGERAPLHERGKERLVVLDSNVAQETTSYLRRHLEDYEVIAATEAEELAHVVENEHPVAVITGSMLEMTTVSEKLLPGVPVFGIPLPFISLPGENMPFDLLLTKPVTSKDLLDSLRKFAQGGAVLVVDDDRGFVQLVRRMIEAAEESFEVVWAYDAEEAIYRLQEHTPSVVLLDLMIGPISGLDLIVRIRTNAEWQHLPVVAVTGAGEMLRSGERTEFSLSKRTGLREGEVLDLLRGALRSVRADYLASGPKFVSPITTEPVTRVSGDKL